MKYVRTKEWIYDLDAKGIRNCVPIEDGKKIKVLRTVLSNGKPVYDALDVLKESDNIEELCDAFVVVYQNNRLPDIMQGKFAQQVVKHSNDCVAYGAIWTDKGLIYVAKMNEQGELVLL